MAGTLDAVGTSSEPVIFTSENDNSVGGDTGSGSPDAGDWAGIGVTGTAELTSTTLDYAGTAIYFDGTTGFADSGSLIQTSNTAIDVADGVFSFQGSLQDDSEDVSACDWLSGCVADAYYANGVGVEETCGTVTTPTGPLFESDNCDETPTPEDTLDSAASEFSSLFEDLTDACADGEEGACAELEAASTCITGDVASLETVYPWMPDGDPVDADEYADEAIASADEYVAGAEPQVLNYPTGLPTLGTYVSSGASGIAALGSAYPACLS